MSLSELRIKDVRNIVSAHLLPSSRLNVLVGANGSGKTSFLEAIYLLSRARSFRTHNIKKVINNETSSLLVFAKLDHTDANNHIAIKKDPQETTIRINGKTEKKSSELNRFFHAHLIRPESQALLESGSSLRRSFVDWGVFHVEHEFLDASKKYNHTLKQRNKLLKSKRLDTLDVWSDKLVEYGIIISNHRERYVSELESAMRLISSGLLGEVMVSIEYVKGWDKGLSYEQALTKSFARDAQYGYTTVGQHKSDIRVLVDGRLAQDHLSRGQMKLLIIALYLAQIKMMRDQGNKSICVLMDDLASELDAVNFKKVMLFLVGLGIQVFVTTTDEAPFLEYINHKDSKVFHVKHGRVIKGDDE
ncbi:MAG: DNA replication/repair protein RecF [Cycloclasticus sp.]|nr:DNA replication/repair protein RecF [Cycloclasticus sp.]MBQ0790158.1 DNA replication/repair protein RecF [Cycloclasticus sp.]